ncbi:4Fe-4S binding domain-containing protein [Caloramator fervidus]|uniref:4Fe-4S binding domain-containing protein n=1 Tax=Caloramator fervidus TaxID=29344 RepID=A0A1H5RM89_9CLOT|nr:4Fe-4S binding protein [Caloramator fervidus]SEF38611.1 4Fe-4S binding domain-containing protein [Caloramator fervidus]
MIRKIVHIDEEKCNGCGLCIPNCAEGALKIIDGKAKLVKESLCDGLGACIGYCPQGAITIIEREADEFDEKAVQEHLSRMENENHNIGGCPGSMIRQINRQWPVQLALVSPSAPYLYRSDLLIAADCTAYAYDNFHNDFIKDRTVVVGCPKLDDNDYYIEKLTEIIKNNDLKSITVVKMEVPCCSGISMAAKVARDRAGVKIPIKVVTIGIDGEILDSSNV